MIVTCTTYVLLKNICTDLDFFFNREVFATGGGGFLPELHLKDRIGWLHHVNKCVCGDGGRQGGGGASRVYNTQSIVLESVK